MALRPLSPVTLKLSSRSAWGARALAALAVVVSAAGCGSTGASRRAHASPIAASAPPPASTSARVPTLTPAATSLRALPRAQVVSTATARRPAPSSSPRKPPIVWDPIPFGLQRKAQMAAYVRRHYSSFMKPTWRLIDPHVIVIHYTDASFSSTYNTFATDVPDSELHELPATSAHFVIDSNGAIHQLVSLGTMARHTVGLNWTAIGIEHVGFSDSQVLSDHAQITASLHLVHWLRCRYHVEIRNVIGHAESLSSPFHDEDVP